MKTVSLIYNALLLICFPGWDQSDKYVKIYISSIAGLDKLSQENVSSEFQQRYVDDCVGCLLILCVVLV